MMEEVAVKLLKNPIKINKTNLRIKRILIFNGFRRIKMHLKSRKLKIHFNLKVWLRTLLCLCKKNLMTKFFKKSLIQKIRICMETKSHLIKLRIRGPKKRFCRNFFHNNSNQRNRKTLMIKRKKIINQKNM